MAVRRTDKALAFTPAEKTRGAEPQESEMGEVIQLVVLPRGARPRRAERIETMDLVPQRRELQCESYSTCLTFAVRAKWKGFHCAACQHFCDLT